MIKQNGQTLIEVLVALAAVVVVITSITFSVISALHNDEFSKNQNLATQYAQQGLDILRAMRNADYNKFMGFQSGYYCMDSTCTSINGSPSTSVGVSPNLCGTRGGTNCPNDPNVAGIFARYGYLEKNSSTCPQIVNGQTTIDVMEATVIVGWQDSKCSSNNTYCHSVKLSTCLSNFETPKE